MKYVARLRADAVILRASVRSLESMRGAATIVLMHFHLLSRMLFHNHRRVFVNTEHISNQNKTRAESKQLLFPAAICSRRVLPVLLVTAEEGSHLLTTGVSVQSSCNNVY